MEENNSPWIRQLKRTRPIEPLTENIDTDIVVVGGGIAGITTAYFILTNTDKKVVLVEANEIAHGATGHNAGQITSYFEKTFKELVTRYGLARAAAAQKVIEEDARVLLESIYSNAALSTPYSQFMGHDGLTTFEQVITSLEDLRLKAEAGIRFRPLLVAREWDEHRLIPLQYAGLYTIVQKQSIESLLETNNTDYIAALPFLSGCMNSALFTEELAGYLLSVHANRFTLFEHTTVSNISFHGEEVIIAAGLNSITAEQVVLCTNGFESVQFSGEKGKEIDARFHHEVMGLIGYMGAYLEPLKHIPFAGIYSHPTQSEVNDPYYYVTRRPYELEANETHNLICIGGPVRIVPDRADYDQRQLFPQEVVERLETFASVSFRRHPKPFDFYWHGLMGYTKSWVRLIGPEPRNPLLLYNLGCNGVGILTSIYGAAKIARIINKEVLEASIFDPR